MKKPISIFIGLLLLISSCQSTFEETGNYTSGKLKYRIVYEGDKRSKTKMKETKFYENGKTEYTGTFSKNKRFGNWKYWYDNGTLWTECEYKNGLKHGTTTNYYKNGKIKIEGQYLNGKMSGLWIFFNEKGEKLKELQY